MIKKLLDYFKLTSFVVAIFIGIQLPSFVDQYEKNLAARVAESNHSLIGFKADADRFFNGDLQKLIAHYAKQPDVIVQHGGHNIEQLVNRNTLLNQALMNFNRTFYSHYEQVFFYPVEDIREQVWQNYDHTIVLNSQAMMMGIFVGILMLALFELTCFTCVCSCRKVFKRY